MKFIIINGPNLNLLGKRQPTIYGTQSFEDYFHEMIPLFPDHELSYFKSNHEGALIDKIHDTGFTLDGIVLNAGGYTHTSVALADAVAAIDTPVVEVHISNIYERESFRHHSFLKTNCVESIVGKGMKGYQQAIDYLIDFHKNK